MAKTVLCYGDSNTWGFDPRTEGRYPYEVRWPGVLSRELGDAYRVIEEGLNARTTVWDDPLWPDTNGKTYLSPCLKSHAPLDLVIIMLGTNDLKQRFSLTAWDIAAGAAMLVELILGSEAGPDSAAPQVILVSPPPVGEMTDLAERFTGSHEKAPRLAAHYQQFAEELGCVYMNAAEFIQPSKIDGLHLDAEEHAKLAHRLARTIPLLLGR